MAKPVRKAPTKKAANAKAAPKKNAKPAMAKVVSHAEFMRRMLAKKEADRLAKEQNQNSKFNMHKMENQTNSATQAHNRFAGPRRKAAV